MRNSNKLKLGVAALGVIAANCVNPLTTENKEASGDMGNASAPNSVSWMDSLSADQYTEIDREWLKGFIKDGLDDISVAKCPPCAEGYKEKFPNYKVENQAGTYRAWGAELRADYADLSFLDGKGTTYCVYGLILNKPRVPGGAL